MNGLKKESERLHLADPWTWAVENRIRLIGGLPFEAEGRQYQREIIQSQAKHKVVKKGSQVGMTTAFILDCSHGLIHEAYPQGVIYYFPTDKAAEMFGKTRWRLIIDQNKCIRRHMTGDSITVKMVGNSPLRLLGARATQVIEGKKDASSMRSEPADYIIRDERDLFDEDMAEQTIQRLGNSTIAKQVDLGTPTIPDYGVDSVWTRSTQRHWFIQCFHCNHWTCLEEDWPNCIKFEGKRAYRSCGSCGREIYPYNGKWVPKYPDKSVEGWWISQLISPKMDDYKLSQTMERWDRVQGEGSGKIGEFYNSVLGLAYIAAENRLTLSDVYACCGTDGMLTRSPGPTAMGVDVQGNDLYTVVGENGNIPRVIYVGVVPSWQALHDLAKRFGVECAVVDAQPERHKVREFASAEPYRVFGCEYRDKGGVYLKRDDQRGIISVNRTEHCDKTHQMIVNQMVHLPRRCTQVDDFAKQMCNVARVLEEDKMTGSKIYRYRKLDQDDYRHAFNYWALALNYTNTKQDTVAIHDPAKDYDPLTYGLTG